MWASRVGLHGWFQGVEGVEGRGKSALGAFGGDGGCHGDVHQRGMRKRALLL